jgi:hypothetical protein
MKLPRPGDKIILFQANDYLFNKIKQSGLRAFKKEYDWKMPHDHSKATDQGGQTHD